MNRESVLERIKNAEEWDVVIVGGGATGAGIALDAASRGLKTLLVEKYDFGKSTSGKSTKLIHGGVRYLQQGNLSLVMEALKERGILYKNAPHLVKNLRFVVPAYNWWESPFYGLGLKLYDTMSGKYGFGDSKLLSAEETLALIPTLETHELRGGIIYYDGQFDDARLLINILQTANELGAQIINYFEVTGFVKVGNKIKGVLAKDNESGDEFKIDSKIVVNATGVFSDELRALDNPEGGKLIEPSRGTHLILDKSFLSGDTAMMIPHTDDGRILFAIPWHNRIILGTTDIEVERPEIEPHASEEEIDFLLKHAARYLSKDPKRTDVLSVFSGLRPLVKENNYTDSAELSREHIISVSESGLISIAGGKWTTYRKMAEDALETITNYGNFEKTECVTENIKIHGYTEEEIPFNYFGMYGSDAEEVKLLCNEYNMYDKIHLSLPFHKGEIIWAVRFEMARTVEDFLSRRTRALLLDAKAAAESAEVVARIMAKELNKNKKWISEQTNSFVKLSEFYTLSK